MTVEQRSIPARKRFSVAHELGHWKYHRGRSFLCRKEDLGNQVHGPADPERIADAYESCGVGADHHPNARGVNIPRAILQNRLQNICRSSSSWMVSH
ncbi:ImmA/IrrE family metallo-endopeptidase [Phenylobacterium sp.]|uniref:ImmA/IrrE family metallo-endopeptidase n=1 Tax=Phenylobacterium sp. TaxID=1871053 RepID=UPI003FA7D8FA